MERRTRSRGSPTRRYGSWTALVFTANSPNASTSASSGTTNIGTEAKDGTLETTIDYTTKNFQKKSKMGQIINGAFESNFESYAVSLTGSCNLTFTGSSWFANQIKTKASVGNSYYGMYIVHAPPLTPSVDIEAAKALAGTAAAASVDEPEVQGLVDLAELRKTLQMLRQPLRDVRNLALGMRRGYNKYRRNISRGIGGGSKGSSLGTTAPRRVLNFSEWASGKYLEVRYGWTPLLGTIEGLIKVMSKGKKGLRKTARAQSFVPSQTGSKVDTKVGYPYSISKSVRTFNVTKTTSVRCGILYESNFALASQLGFNWHEVPSTAWELVPYSFVVDWFVNVGDWLRAVTPKAGINELASWTSTKEVENFTVSDVTSPNGTDPNYTCTGTSTALMSLVRVKKIRNPGVGIALVSKLGEIDFSRPKDLKHAADAVALIIGALKGHPVSARL